MLLRLGNDKCGRSRSRDIPVVNQQEVLLSVEHGTCTSIGAVTFDLIILLMDTAIHHCLILMHSEASIQDNHASAARGAQANTASTSGFDSALSMQAVFLVILRSPYIDVASGAALQTVSSLLLIVVGASICLDFGARALKSDTVSVD